MKRKVEQETLLLDVLKIMQPQASTNVLRKMLTNRRITVEEKIIHLAKHIVLFGETVEIRPKPKLSIEETRQTSAETHSLDIIFEDDAILVVEKPAGLLSVATDRLEVATLHNRCVEYCRELKKTSQTKEMPRMNTRRKQTMNTHATSMPTVKHR